MNTQQSTPDRKAALAAAFRTARLAGTVSRYAHGARIVHVTPVWTDVLGPMRVSHVLHLLDVDGRPMEWNGSRSALVHALRVEFPHADWEREHRYDVRTGAFDDVAPPTLPADLDAQLVEQRHAYRDLDADSACRTVDPALAAACRKPEVTA